MKTPWIIIPKPKPKPSLRLFCFPYAGAGASIYHNWSTLLPPEIEVCSIQLPGRESRTKEPLFYNIEPLINALTPSILPLLDIPFIFFGHSLGALICFELARQLRRLKQPNPLHLFVSAREAPQNPLTKPPVHQLSDADFIKELSRFNGTPKAVLQNVELMNYFLPILRADLAINETYKYTPEPPLNCPISVFGGLQDLIVSSESLAVWNAQTNCNFSSRIFSGDHFFLKSQQQLLLEAIYQDSKYYIK